MRKYIIGTISGIDTPLNAADRSGREFSCFITDTDYETLKREREQILSTNVENIRELAPLVREAMADNNKLFHKFITFPISGIIQIHFLVAKYIFNCIF